MQRYRGRSRKRVGWLLALSLLCVARPAPLSAVLTVGVNDQTLLPNTPGQWIDILVSGADDVSGVDLFLQVGGGGPQLRVYDVAGSSAGPAIRDVDLKTGTIFAGVSDTAINMGSTTVEIPQVAVWTLSLTGATRTVPAAGTLARVQLDTTGFFGGSWELQLSDVLPYDEFGGPYTTNFAGLPATVVNGWIRIPISRGDYNANQQFDVADIDALAQAIRGHSTDLNQYDLNSDQQVDTSDHRIWVEQFAHTYQGDANLDGLFSTADFVQVFAAGKYEDDLPLNATWSDGDWDGDGDFTTSDLVAAFQHGGYEQGFAAAHIARLSAEPTRSVRAVPEPASYVSTLVGILLVLRRRQRGTSCGT